MIRIENLTKTFDGFTALDGLSLHVKQGSIYGMVGVNGAGKTTAIKHLAGLYRQESGDVSIDGAPVFDNALLKSRVGYIPDELYFFPFYTMRMQHNFLRRLYSPWGRWNEERYGKMLALMGLDEKRRLGKFSKGMQKQAAFIFAMSAMPDVLLLDEPIDGLDPLVRKVVFELIIEDVAQRGLTVLISSHNLKEMDGICDAVGIIKAGRMGIERDLDDLKADVHKIQVAFPVGEAGEFSLLGPDIQILHREKRGGVELLVVRGAHDLVEAKIKAMNPLLYDHLPLTLEEVFVYENLH
ncbi:MAG: ABC transporter ATP-binding protein [Defluviitaleaceae bacterium]|nr:ABC transporter ATP-binding protein [Defluviitaleaceae bacterium]MCL2238562.1 ABC transporter ATP-binding protein [Defluviitaleaceae bacterium]